MLARQRRSAFDAGEQPHFEERRIISARLGALLAEAAVEAVEAEHDASKAFSEQAKLQIQRSISDDGWRLDLVVQQAVEIAKEYVVAGERAAAIFATAGRVVGLEHPIDPPNSNEWPNVNEIHSINCERCAGIAERFCQGAFNDDKLFKDADSPGGLCMFFVRDLVENLFDFSEQTAAELVTGLELAEPPARILLRMNCSMSERDCSLPINGRWDWAPGAPEAALIVEWPETDNFDRVDDAILVLPYLIFHEFFVHGIQGRAAPIPVVNIPPICGFTEGFLDAAARRTMEAGWFSADDRPPPSLWPLREKMRKKMQGCNDARKDPGPEPDHAPSDESKTLARNIRKARADGARIWEYLTNVEDIVAQRNKWALSCAVLMNAQFTEAQRDSFVQEIGYFMRPRTERRMKKVWRRLNEYLIKKAPEELISGLRADRKALR